MLAITILLVLILCAILAPDLVGRILAGAVFWSIALSCLAMMAFCALVVFS